MQCFAHFNLTYIFVIILYDCVDAEAIITHILFTAVDCYKYMRKTLSLIASTIYNTIFFHEF